MIKRSESKTKCSRRKQRSAEARRKRRLQMEGLERRELLAGDLILPTPTNIQVFSGPRNIGTVQAAQFFESETAQESGKNDFFNQADVVPLGTGPGQQDTIDVRGSMSFTASQQSPEFLVDIDTFAVDLRAGDILDIATQGAAGPFTVLFDDGRIWFGADENQGITYPANSPLQNLGNSVFAQVIPEDGRYYISLAPDTTAGAYTMGLRVYRPVTESLPIGQRQILFVDLDGGFYPRSLFPDGSGIPQPGIVRVPAVQDSLALLGIQIDNQRALDDLIDQTMDETVRMFAALGINGSNGDYDLTGNPGDFGITILNSRDHADPGGHPLVSRVVLGGDSNDTEIPPFARASTVDIGNFNLTDTAAGSLEGVLAFAGGVALDPSVSQLDAVAKFLAFLIAHESGHFFGERHTRGDNTVINIMDEGPGSTPEGVIGAGPDLIFGTTDDVNVDFVTDLYTINEGLFEGRSFTAKSLSHELSTGTVGGTVAGRAFRDANRDGSGSGDLGLPGVQVFADVNGNGVVDPSEPQAITGADGRYSLSVAPGTVNIIAIPPVDFSATTATSVSTTVTASGISGAINFGFGQVNPNATGAAFIDNNGNGFRDAGDTGLGGVYVYIDLDGDNVPDLAEPGTNTAADGTYSLNFPGPGNYTIRDVVPPGFEQTFPASGEHNVFFNGVSLGGNFDFGLLPSQDFGDAPDSYGTTLAANGARHGITSGLSIGAAVDREIDGQPTATANGDDLSGVDDEDGVRLLNPLGPGAAATFSVTVTNTSGVPAFLQGFIDFNRDGDFNDLGEKFASDIPVANGLVNAQIPVVVNVPANVSIGSSFTRFRLSQTPGLGPVGFAQSGEVEDNTFPILTAAQLANNDTFTVSRNTLSNQLDVLGNDFQTPENPLQITNLNVTGTSGSVVLAGDAKSVFYTPPNGFIGRDVFSYTVRDAFGNTSTATVTVNVNFQSNVPIALDDIFSVPEGASNRALNVLDNDVPSVSGGLTITSVGPGDAGGTVSIVGGGQSLRYTPPAGFNGTEQFTYSVQDAAGSSDTAQVTVNMLPGSLNDDQIEFSIGLFDAVNINTPITNVQVGDDFLVRVTVDDLTGVTREGVASAFLDVLYTDELVATLNTDNDPTFPFDITFGPLFSGGGVLQRGDAQVPGLINEVGGLQRIDAQQAHNGPVELFTLKMRAVSPGVAVFQGDPADEAVSETVLLGRDTALTAAQQRLGRAELFIAPESDNFTSAIDDAFPDGRDSDGILISAGGSRHDLRVLENDNLGPTGTVREFGLVTNPTFGNVFIDNNGTPTNLNDDFFSYEPNVNANGLERFTYLIVTDDNIRSTAEVTISLGNQQLLADVAYDLELVDSLGNSINPNTINVGDRIGVRVNATDLRVNATFVFAGFIDLLYNSNVLRPSDLNQGDAFDFDVEFGPGYVSDPDVNATAIRPGIIDEVGTLFASVPVNTSGLNGGELMTVFFDVIGNGPVNLISSPADSSPFQDTLVFAQDDPVPVNDIRYGRVPRSVVVGPQQNSGLRQDVNNDGFVSPIDALLVINTISRTDAAEGEQSGLTASSSRTFFTDVNGDNRTTALDALHVINYLKHASDNRAAGEQVAVIPERQYETDLSTSHDEAAAEIESSSNLADAQYADQQSAATPAVGGTDAASNDDEEDLLNLLADDVSQQWS